MTIPGSPTGAPSDGAHPQIRGLSYVRHLGGGGFGDVYLYESHAPRRMVAVKVVKSRDLSDEAIAKFLDEANAMAGVEHPHIVHVYAVGRAQDGRPYFSMQYYPEGTMDGRLRSELAQGRQLSVPEVLRVGIEIGSAIESAHRADLIHRDIKPANLLVGRDGATALTDFGVAANLAADSDEDDVGVSVPWAPPEMLYSDTRGSAASDVYSLAATLWHLLVGRSPFELPRGDNSRFELMNRVRDTQPRPTGRADVPASFEGLLRRALGKNPASRQPTAADFVRGLQGVERELRLPPTKAVFLDDHGPIAPMPDAGATVRRDGLGLPPPGGTIIRPRDASARQVVDQVPFDGPARTTVRPSSGQPRATGIPPTFDDGGRTKARSTTGPPPGSGVVRSGSPVSSRAHPDSDTDRTQRRAEQISHVDAPVAADPKRSRRNTGMLVGIAAAVVLAIAVVGFIVLRSGREPEKATPLATVTASSTLEVVPVAGPPGPVRVVARRAGGRVIFTWTYDNALTTDGYRIKFASGDPVTSDQPTLSVPAPKTGKVCASVQVRRDDASQAVTEWSPAVCG